jgi:glycosyltransferase involved in cell wall biosynthesis
VSTCMKIAFFGSIDACDPMKIGGGESVVRRLAVGLSDKGHSVVVVIYGADEKKNLPNFLGHNVRLEYCTSFSDSLKVLADLSCDLIVETYIHKRDYPRYLAFKHKNRKLIRFSIIFMASASQILKRWFRSRLRTMFCGTIFAVSLKLVDELARDGVSAIWLPPPVPDQYFSFSERAKKAKTVISFLGRIAPDKGLASLIRIFNSVVCSEQFTFKIRGYYIPNEPDSVRLHESLQKKSSFEYNAEPYDSCHYSVNKEQVIIECLVGTDILVLPYKSLKRTVDLPLLVVEGLAAGCAVISHDFEDVSRIICSSALIARDEDEYKEKLQKLCDPKTLQQEKERIKTSDLFATFATTKVVEKFLNHFKYK